MKYYKELIDWSQLIIAAEEARKNAYAPYSKFRVGASVETDIGLVFAGCNVENASYGLTNCAERTAIFKMVTDIGVTKIKRVCVMLDGATKQGGSPCGACRQVIWEFTKDPAVEVLMIDPEGGYRLSTIGELLPDAFVLDR